MKFWSWLDGKKTVIGAALLWVALFTQDIIVGRAGVTAEWVVVGVEALNWIGFALVPAGIAHKGMKAKANKGATDG